MIGPFTCIADLRAEILESPVWDAHRSVLFVCSITGREILEIDLDRGVRRRWNFEQDVASLGLCESGSLVVALARQVILFDPETTERRVLWDSYDGPEESRLNDGKVGPDGAFWVGSMDSRKGFETSVLYRIDSSGTAVRMQSGLMTSNGLAWSLDAKTMFHSDSRGEWLDRYDFEPSSGAMSNRTCIAHLDDLAGRPDGGACDVENYYWSAGVSAGVINRFSFDGRIVEKLQAPVPAPTMPCFCGPDLDHIAITSHRFLSSETLAAAPQSGGVFLAKSKARGVPVARMREG
ncbi:SMP-30/gluconolactonase/LRE family protein [Limoniibacter endophyticus]|uniref:SMP-30/Gluconolactonase/LRE-like region domain-containing protein n=1 Tax=Limoniibacter endophyticus TaxID=1565040 RepID=A0A8J3DRJ5_9HYPH|nr:SMP-30/gluconolactonase/LRE family protein [Limoniibacter endophyticus]GHC76984.1 hypothetical protein GCM10010136_28190 [Limoniibacter endophyticus]